MTPRFLASRRATFRVILTTLAIMLAAHGSVPLQARNTGASPNHSAQDDSISGRWKAGGGIPGGTQYIILRITQSGDSLNGTAVVEKNGMPTDAQADLVGIFKDNKLELHSPFVDGLRMTGTLRRDVIRMRVTPGRFQEAAAYETVFRRDP